MTSRKIKYVVKCNNQMPMEYNSKYFGKASLEGLIKMVESYNKSVLPGGVNAHLNAPVFSGKIELYNQDTHKTIAMISY